MQNDSETKDSAKRGVGKAAAAQPVAWLRDAHEGEGDECLVPAAAGDPGAFAVFTEDQLVVSDLLEALRPFAEAHAMGDNYVKFSPRLIEAARQAIQRAEGGGQ